MKNEFYNKSKRASVYSSIYFYKIISLIILVVLTIIMTSLYREDRARFNEEYAGPTPKIFIVMTICLLFFVFSILLDFYILGRTASIGRHLNKLAYIDKLTGLPNRYSCDLLFDSFNNPHRLPEAGFILLNIHNLYVVNEQSGHDNGNFIIAEFCSILEDVGADYGYVGRNGGNEFVMMVEQCDSTKADMFLLDLTKRIHGYNEMNVGAPLEIAYSRVLNCDEHKESVSELVSLGYQKLKESPQILS